MGRNEEKQLSSAPRRKETPRAGTKDSAWKAFPRTTLSVTCDAPESQGSLKKNMRTSHVENTV